ncbi:MAG TPA: hypothetical protein VIF60_01475 [Burkholderiaceae bacterium]
MLPAQFALADNGAQAQLSPEANGQSRTVTHLENFRFSLPPLDEGQRVKSAQLHSGPGVSSVRLDESKKETPNGLHWTSTDSHPGLGYRINNNEDVRVHLGRHGAMMNVAVHF